MGFELERVLYETEDFLRRNLTSASIRQAKKRKLQRTMREMMRRVRRSMVVLVAILIALVAWSIFVDPIGFLTWMIAIATALLVAFLTLFYPSRRREPTLADAPKTARLDELAVRAADGLLDRCPDLPGRALPAAESIIGRLHELAPHLGALDADPVSAGEARRLICEHLPRLVDSYLALPARERAPGSESSLRFADSLSIVAQELDSLLDRCCRDRRIGFDTQHRFIESRYQEDRRLKGE